MSRGERGKVERTNEFVGLRLASEIGERNERVGVRFLQLNLKIVWRGEVEKTPRNGANLSEIETAGGICLAVGESGKEKKPGKSKK